MLKTFLREENIHNVADLRNWIASRKDGDLHDSSTGSRLEYLNKSDMGLDGENRVYGDKIGYCNRVLDANRIVIADASVVEFRECIICGDLLVQDRGSSVSSVTLDDCIILGSVTFGNLSGAECISCYQTNCRRLYFKNCRANNVRVTSCRIGELILESTSGGAAYISDNSLVVASVYKTAFASVYADYEQFDADALLSSNESPKTRAAIESLNLFALSDGKHIDVLANRYYRECAVSTFAFIREMTSIQSDKKAYSKLRHAESQFYQTSVLGRVVNVVFGSFVRPMQIVLLAILAQMLFVFTYTMPASQFVIKEKTINGLSVLESIYFSGITMSTVGYGDIVPLNWIRVAVVLEGVLGIVLGSCFVASLVRKYVD